MSNKKEIIGVITIAISIIGIGCVILIVIAIRRCFQICRVFQEPSLPKPTDRSQSGTRLQHLVVQITNRENQTSRNQYTSHNIHNSANCDNIYNRVLGGYQDTQDSNIFYVSNPTEDFVPSAPPPSYDEAMQSP